MKTILILATLFISSHLFPFEKLADDYIVYYGKQNAPVKIVQYFSFTCPHCVDLYRRQFSAIKEAYIATDKISWVFHPVPMDLLTVQAMACLEKLPLQQKRIFLEAILEELLIDNSTLSALLMQKGMEVLGKPIPQLLEKSYLSDTRAFSDAFAFLKQEEKIEAVPAVEVNGVFLSGQIPDIDFIEEAIHHLGGR